MDTLHKVYMIVERIHRFKDRHTRYNELLIKSGRSEQAVNEALEELVKRKMVWWDKNKSKAVAVRDKKGRK